MLEKTKIELLEAAAIPMVGFQLASSEVLDLTPQVVKDFRAIPATPTERDLSEKRVTHLDDKINKGLCVTFHWVTAEINNAIRRVNGQHSSTALARRCLTADSTLVGDGGYWPKNLKVHREHYKVDNHESLVLLFRQFDDRASGRTPLDISGAYQGLFPDLNEVNRKNAKLTIDGFIWYSRFVEEVPVSAGDDVYDKFNDTGLHPMIKWIDGLLTGRCKEMKHPAIIGAVVGTFMVNESAARDFWQEVVSPSNGDDSVPSVLSDWLISIAADKVERPKPAHLYQGCIWAWNAWRSNKNITVVKDDIKKDFLKIHD